MLIHAIIPGQPERMRRMLVQMRTPAYPDSAMQLRAWKIDAQKVVFQYVDLDRERAVLNNCEFE